MAEPVATVASVDGLRVHRFQVVRESRAAETNESGRGGRVEEWIVVGFADGSEEVRLADPGFERTRSVPLDAFRSGRFEPLVAGGVPVWGY